MQAINEEWVSQLLGVRDKSVYKNQLGQALIIAGNQGMAGACILASRACVYSGAGLTRVLTHENHLSLIYGHIPEAMVHAWQQDKVLEEMDRATTILLGPGLGQTTKAVELFKLVFQQARSDQVIILDADGLNLWAQDPRQTKAKLVMTPHEGEWRRLVRGRVDQDPSHFAHSHQVFLVKKSPQTVIYAPEGSSYQNIAGNPGMATGGMGDCLAGMITGIIGQTKEVLAGCLVASYLHAKIANQIFQTDYTVIPSRLIEAIPSAMKELTDSLEGGKS